MWRPSSTLLGYVLGVLQMYAVTEVSSEKGKFYLLTERPKVTYTNPKYVSFANMTAVRYGRQNPMYYVNIHLDILIPLDNNVVVYFQLYEYYNSQYRRSFLDLSYKWCNLYNNDLFFGAAMRRAISTPCPHKPGVYHMRNLTVALEGIPNFPYVKGRIYCNLTIRHDLVGSGYIDMELKRMKT